jgi:hypothetical protein
MARPVRFKKQHKAVGFGDPYNPRSVEGHRNAVAEASESRRYNRFMKDREAEKAGFSSKPWLAKLWDRLCSRVF